MLEAARDATTATGWEEVVGEYVGLELIVRAPANGVVADATNLLGGVGDTLQRKVARPSLSLDYLGELGSVALFADDRQIRDVRYRQENAAKPSYKVRIWIL